jgi:hypothetical protein
MSKSSKAKKNKVPKITEEEYAKYVSALKGEGQVCDEMKSPPQTQAETKSVIK